MQDKAPTFAMYTWYNLSFPLPVSKGMDTIPNRPVAIPVRIALVGGNVMPISLARKATCELPLGSNHWGTSKWPLNSLRTRH